MTKKERRPLTTDPSQAGSDGPSNTNRKENHNLAKGHVT